MKQTVKDLSPSELATALGVSKATVARWKKLGCPHKETAPFAIGSQASRPRFNLEEVKAWIKSKQAALASYGD